MKLKRILFFTLFFVVLNVACVREVSAKYVSLSKIGIFLTLKDENGKIVEQVYLFKSEPATYMKQYVEYPKYIVYLPFNEFYDQYSEDIIEWFENESNLQDVFNKAGFQLSIQDIKKNKYTLSLDYVRESYNIKYRKCYNQSNLNCTDWSDYEPHVIASNGEILEHNISNHRFSYIWTGDIYNILYAIDHAGICGPQSTYRDFDSIESAIGNEKYLDKALGNSTYCPVYCVEENIFTFPGFKPEVNSGAHFTWTTREDRIIDGLTVELNGKRNCRTKIDLEGWEKDYIDLLEEIEKEIKKLTASSNEIRHCSGDLGEPTFCGWKLISDAEIWETIPSSGVRTECEHDMKNAAKSNYYLHCKGQPVTDIPWAQSLSGGRVYQSFEAGCPCEEKFDQKYTQSARYESQAAADNAAKGAHGAKCNAGYGSIGNNATRITCSSHKEYVGRRLVYDANGNIALDHNGNPIYEDVYKYWNTVTVYQRICNYSGMQITASDLNKCINTGLRECPAGYHWATSPTVCYKTDTSYLERLLKQQQSMLDILDECSKISFNYELNTEMKVDFEEPVYKRVEGLVRTQTSSTLKENHVVRGGSKSVTFYECNLSTAKKWCWSYQVDITEDWIKEYGKEFNVSYDYTLPKEIYQYVLFPRGQSVDVVPSNYGNSLTGFQNYLNIGYSNYPVHYTTPQGLYNLDIIYNNVGYNDRFTEMIREYHPDAVNNEKVIYDCEYNVLNGRPFCPSGGCDEDDSNGIKLIYRPISLLVPFPGTDGEGRSAGYNWSSNSTISKYILNNRNTEGYSVYNKEPMYEITLTPANIKEIREYNKTTTYDDYNLSCVNGYECKSDFIRESTLGFSKYFSGCGTGNWNQCDKDDGYTR